MEYRCKGYCSVSESYVEFEAKRKGELADKWLYSWMRGSLRCPNCLSMPRKRALAQIMNSILPDWRDLTVHGSSGSGPLSGKLRRECNRYSNTGYYPDLPFGELHPTDKNRNENIERQTFDEELFDLVITQDVFEHVFNPDLAIKEIVRSLKIGSTI